jgi:hypothetical protein
VRLTTRGGYNWTDRYPGGSEICEVVTNIKDDLLMLR